MRMSQSRRMLNMIHHENEIIDVDNFVAEIQVCVAHRVRSFFVVFLVCILLAADYS